MAAGKNALRPLLIAVTCFMFVALGMEPYATDGSVFGNQGNEDGATNESVSADSRPNIVFIFSDDHACHSISAYGSNINKTPHIDRIASRGALFVNNFCGNSICAPSRATVLTGLHSHANGQIDNRVKFDGSQQTFPKLLQKAGYSTALIGKWHLKSDPTGFDYWDVLLGQGQYYNPDFKNASGVRRVDGYATDVTTDLGLEWLRKQDKDKPFCLMLQHKAPHRTWMPGPNELSLYKDETIAEPDNLFDDWKGRGPAATNNEMSVKDHLFMGYDLQNPQGDDEQYAKAGINLRNRMNPEQRKLWEATFAEENELLKRARLSEKGMVQWKYQRYIKNYLRCVAGVDRNVGRVMDYLDQNGLSENTILVYASDQGFYLGDHGWYDKRWMYEESMRMPMVMSWPGKIKPGKRIESLTQNIDFAPTFLAAAGVKPEKAMHGRSMLPLFDDDPNNDDWREALYYHYVEPKVHNVAAHYGVRTDRYKLIYFYEPEYKYFELYDLEKDPREMQSVYGQPEYVELGEKLKKRLAELRQGFKDTTGTEMPFATAPQ